MTDAASARYEIYEDSSGEWRWRLVVQNGNIVADSGQGYASRGGAIRATNTIREHAPKAIVEFPNDRSEEIAEH